jgi:hypothetical protein
MNFGFPHWPDKTSNHADRFPAGMVKTRKAQ